MSDVWVVRNRHGDIVQTCHDEPHEQPDGWTTTRETLLTPEMAALIEAAKAYCGNRTVALEHEMIDAVAALRALEGDV
jgi:flagellar basal body rod protein FlgC